MISVYSLRPRNVHLTEVGFLGHIIGHTGLACDPENMSAVRNWHEPNRVKKNFAEIADLLVALTRKRVPFVWAAEQQTPFDALKASLLSAPI